MVQGLVFGPYIQVVENKISCCYNSNVVLFQLDTENENNSKLHFILYIYARSFSGIDKIALM